MEADRSTQIAAVSLLSPPIFFLIWRLATITERLRNEIALRVEDDKKLLIEIAKWEGYTRASSHEWRTEADRLQRMILKVTPVADWPND